MSFPRPHSLEDRVHNNSNNVNNMSIVNSAGAMAPPPTHQNYLPMGPSSNDYTMSSHMNMYSGYSQMPVSIPSYANAYQQAVNAALSNPYANGGLPTYFGAPMNMGSMALSGIDDPTSMGLHIGGGAPSSDQTSPGRVSYEEELMAQHSMSVAAPSKPPPPSGPAPSAAISPMQTSGDSSGGFVYGSSINYSQYAAIASAVSPVSQLNVVSNSDKPYSYKEKKGSKQHQQQLLPEHERCTLKCSGIPHYVTEQDIRTHFEAFGYVVELQIVSPPSSEDNLTVDGKKKVYNECLVQFYSAANAKKCFTSPLPVLNNRFIHLHVSTFNITPVTDVPTPNLDVIERDAKLLNESILISAASSSTGPTDRKKSHSVHTQGVSNKYRRLSGEHSLVASATAAVVRTETNDSNMTSSGDRKDSNALEEGSSFEVDPTEAHVEGAKSVILSPSGVVLTKEKLELKEKHEQLKVLRQQAEEILKTKEGVLQVCMYVLTLSIALYCDGWMA